MNPNTVESLRVLGLPDDTDPTDVVEIRNAFLHKYKSIQPETANSAISKGMNVDPSLVDPIFRAYHDLVKNVVGELAYPDSKSVTVNGYPIDLLVVSNTGGTCMMINDTDAEIIRKSACQRPQIEMWVIRHDIGRAIKVFDDIPTKAFDPIPQNPPVSSKKTQRTFNIGRWKVKASYKYLVRGRGWTLDRCKLECGLHAQSSDEKRVVRLCPKAVFTPSPQWK